MKRPRWRINWQQTKFSSANCIALCRCRKSLHQTRSQISWGGPSLTAADVADCGTVFLYGLDACLEERPMLDCELEQVSKGAFLHTEEKVLASEAYHHVLFNTFPPFA
jgi:hypothetical protein